MNENDQAAQESGNTETLRQQVAMLEAVVENFPGGLLLFDKNLRLVFCNGNQKRLLEYPEALFADGPPSIEKIFWLNAHRGEYGEGEPAEQVAKRLSLVRKGLPHMFERTRPNGTVLRIKGVPLAGGGFMTTYLDVTEEHRNKSALAYLALHDTVTGLSNRTAFMLELAERIESLAPQQSGAVVFIDLNKFKAVNDTLGHAAGDELLKRVGNRLRRSIRDCDFLARLGGDEFAIIQADVTSMRDVKALATRIQGNVCKPYEIQGQDIEIGASIGISVFPDHAMDSEHLVALADRCMYDSKANKTAYCVWPVPKPKARDDVQRKRRSDFPEGTSVPSALWGPLADLAKGQGAK